MVAWVGQRVPSEGVPQSMQGLRMGGLVAVEEGADFWWAFDGWCFRLVGVAGALLGCDCSRAVGSLVE
jgi:hypothetical protein